MSLPVLALVGIAMSLLVAAPTAAQGRGEIEIRRSLVELLTRPPLPPFKDLNRPTPDSLEVEKVGSKDFPGAVFYRAAWMYNCYDCGSRVAVVAVIGDKNTPIREMSDLANVGGEAIRRDLEPLGLENAVFELLQLGGFVSQLATRVRSSNEIDARARRWLQPSIEGLDLTPQAWKSGGDLLTKFFVCDPGCLIRVEGSLDSRNALEIAVDTVAR